MRKKKWWLGLQFFAGEGASSGGDGGDGGATTGVGTDSGTPVDAGQETKDVLEQMGVPKDKVEKYRAKRGKPVNQAPAQQEEPKQEVPQQQDANAEAKPRDFDKEWNDILNVPEFKNKVSDIVTNRVKNLKQQWDNVSPILEVIGRKYGFDMNDLSNVDYESLAKSVSDDDENYERIAADLGVSREKAKEIDQREREAKRTKERAEQTLEEQMLRQHYAKLQAQAAEMQKNFPGFDLEKELTDNRFMRMTSPQGGLSVEEAYYALHHSEIEKARISAAAQRTAQALSASIQSGRSMPSENGSVSRSSQPLPTKMYSQMSKAERAEWIRQAKGGKQFR